MARLYMPSVIILDPWTPVADIADAIRRQIFLSGKSPGQLDYIQLNDPTNGSPVIGFPMTAEVYLTLGIVVMDKLVTMCDPHEAAEGNELLCTLLPEETHQEPADGIYACLYLSDDGGATWFDVSTLEFQPTKEAAVN